MFNVMKARNSWTRHAQPPGAEQPGNRILARCRLSRLPIEFQFLKDPGKTTGQLTGQFQATGALRPGLSLDFSRQLRRRDGLQVGTHTLESVSDKGQRFEIIGPGGLTQGCRRFRLSIQNGLKQMVDKLSIAPETGFKRNPVHFASIVGCDDRFRFRGNLAL